MAGIPITSVQGTKVYLCAENTVVTTPANAATAIAAGKEVLFYLELGDITETKSVTTYSPISTNASQKSIGTLSMGSFALNVLYDAADVKGQADMVDMWENDERRQIIIEMTDGATTPTYVTYEVALSTQTMSFPKDGAVMYNNTAEQCSKRVVIKAV